MLQGNNDVKKMLLQIGFFFFLVQTEESFVYARFGFWYFLKKLTTLLLFQVDL